MLFQNIEQSVGIPILGHVGVVIVVMTVDPVFYLFYIFYPSFLLNIRFDWVHFYHMLKIHTEYFTFAKKPSHHFKIFKHFVMTNTYECIFSNLIIRCHMLFIGNYQLIISNNIVFYHSSCLIFV